MGYQLSNVSREVRCPYTLYLVRANTHCIRSPNMLLSGSRDKTLIIWNLTRDEQNYGYPKRSLHGHSHIVSDCVSDFRFMSIPVLPI